MGRYKYRARTADGAMVSGTLDADGRAAVFSQLVNRRLVVVAIEEAKNLAAARTSLLLPFRRQSVGADTLIFFTYQLGAMLKAGLPLVRSLFVLEEEMSDSFLREVIRTVRENIETGESLSASLGMFPKVFNRLYVNMVSAGEQSGNIEEVLTRLAKYMDTMLRLRRKIRGALSYPAILVLVTIGVVTMLMIKVIPVFEEIYGSSNVELPVLTQTIIDISRFLRAYLLVIVGSLIVLATMAVWLYRTPPGRRMFQAVLLRLPIVGPLVRKNLLARIARTLGVLVSSGMPMLSAMTLVRQASNNMLFEEAIGNASREVERGETLSDSLRGAGQFSSMFLQMVSAGEETGKLPEMLSNLADFYENEVNVMADMLSTLLEPIFIVGVGGTIGVIVVAMYLPIFQLGKVMQ
jgi:type IV pilus assembly protein PilC